MRVCYVSASLLNAEAKLDADLKLDTPAGYGTVVVRWNGAAESGTVQVRGEDIGSLDHDGRVVLLPKFKDRWYAMADDPFEEIRTGTVHAILKLTNEEFKEERLKEIFGRNPYLKLNCDVSLQDVGLRVRLPSPEASSPCCGSIVEVKPTSVVCSVDNSDERMVLKFVADPFSTARGVISHSKTRNMTSWLHPGPWMFTATRDKAEDECAVIVTVAVQRALGQRLLLLHECKLTDATVVAIPSDRSKPVRHHVSLPSGSQIEVDLNEFNHCLQRLESAAAYKAARDSFCKHLRESCATLQDAITGAVLRVEDQTLQIRADLSRGVQHHKPWVSATAVKDLAPLLLEHSPDRQHGTHNIVPTIVEALPGTGKVTASTRPS